MAEQMKQTPMYTSYVAVAPKPDDFPRLLQAMGDLMRGHFDYSADVKKLTMPTMLIFGDSDMYRPEHIVEFYKLLGGGLRDAGWARETMSKNRLAIIPDQTHYDIFFSPKLRRHRAAVPRWHQRVEDLGRSGQTCEVIQRCATVSRSAA